MLALTWPLVLIQTTIIYVLIIIFLPFNAIYATFFLFALVGFWSRLPGVAIPSPFYLLYMADFIDFFTVIIAVNMGIVPAMLYTFIINISSRACGYWPNWSGVFKDAMIQVLLCPITPFIYSFTGKSLESTMIIFTILRALMFIPMKIIPDEYSLAFTIFYDVIGAGIANVAVNWFYARAFGLLFNNLVTDMRFNWPLFLLSTGIIIYVKKKYYYRQEDSLISEFYLLFRSMIRFGLIKVKTRLGGFEPPA